MNENEAADLVIPLVEETARIDKVTRETGRVLVSTEVTEQLQRVEADLVHETFEVERIPRNEEVSAVPPVRQEDGVLIYPGVEEVLVGEKRLILREEVRVVRRRRTEHVQQDVPVRRMQPVIERTPAKG
ncbi:MAG: YsnF/AvaK domain-containing protein [Proteobacteria bacterium]|nr:YsnF/AvaK domain-containing protein [Pseudomonadota bacterium]